MTKIGAIQLDIKMGDKRTNLSNVLRWLDKIAKEKVDLVCFSEYVTTGCVAERFEELAEPVPGPTTEELSRKAVEHNLYVFAPIAEKDGGKYYSSCVCIDPSGRIVGKQRKVHLFGGPPRQNEPRFVTSGKEYPIFQTKTAGKVGVLMDADIDFPECTRILALKGAQTILVPLTAEYMYVDSCRVFAYASALSNQVYVMLINRVGSHAGFMYFGGSRVVSPLAQPIEVAASIGDREGLITACIDLEALDQLRKDAGSPFRNFHPETYGELESLLLRK